MSLSATGRGEQTTFAVHLNGGGEKTRDKQKSFDDEPPFPTQLLQNDFLTRVSD